MQKIKFRKSGIEINWDGTEDSILDSAEVEGMDLDYSCRGGNCTSCQQKLISGEVEYPYGHSGKAKKGNVLLCCCVPKGESDIVIDA